MKRLLLAVALAFATPAFSQTPAVGDTSIDVSFLTASNFNSSTNRYNDTAMQNLSDFAGQVVLLAYFDQF